MRKLIGIGFALLVAACGGDSPPTIPSTSSSANGWTSLYSPGVTLQSAPGGLIQFAIPLADSHCPNDPTALLALCASVHYVETPAAGLALGKTIVMSGAVVASADAVFNYATATNNTAPGGHAASCRIWFQQAGDDMSSTGAFAYYRWWANDPADVVLQNGAFIVDVVLDPNASGGWTSIMGEQANASTAATQGFQAAIANAANMGFTCGGGSFYGHGVNMQSGTATVILTSYTVK
jgi:hypothetical protein